MQMVSLCTFVRWPVRFLLAAVLLSASTDACSVHIVGGDVSMQAVGTTPGLFRLQLNQYWDVTKSGPGVGNRDASVRLLIYRKQNPVLMDAVVLNLQETVPLIFDNEACATLRKLSFTEGRYYRTQQFDPARYTDPGGYYIVWERCCRNDALTNVANVAKAGVGMVFYLEFPPMQQAGTSLTNSSPAFGVPNGDYICVNKPFTFNAGATDADGDELRYALVTPLNGYTTANVPISTTDAPRNSYPTVTWAPGISLQNAIPGNPALSINPATGQLSVRATQEGLYLFTVQCDEYRNGRRIGSVRRDIQLPVVDCSVNTPPPAVIMIDNTPTNAVGWCPGQTILLEVEKNPTWAYQWQKDGDNLRGQTAPTLRVQEPGRYTVVRSQAKACTNDTVSQATEVRLGTAAPIKLMASPPPYCAGDTLTLRADGQPGYQYRWQRNGQALAGQQATLRVVTSGEYTVLARPDSTACYGRDSLRITVDERPTVQWDSIPPICRLTGEPLTLRATPGGGTYAGPAIAGDRFDPAGAGAGRHRLTYTITTPGGCRAERTRWAVVSPELALTGLTDYQIQKGDSVALRTTASQPVSQYRWEPPTDLSQPDAASPVARPLQTTVYQLTAVSASGCVAALAVRVEVSDRLLQIPTAFSPNADGQNDAWAIPALSLFPRCEVTIYNRWGEPVFYAQGYRQPWDGTYRQERVRAGVYTYQIRTEPGPAGQLYRGQVTVMN